jgi:hypothetical protein
MVEEGEVPRESSLSIEGQLPRAEPPRQESGDPNLGGAVTIGGGMEPLRPQDFAHPERVEGPQPQQMAGLLQPPV